MNYDAPRLRVLAIDPTSKGFGFAVLEGTDRLIDWGVARVWAASEKEFVVRVDVLIERFRPAVVVVENIPPTPRRLRATRRLAALSPHVLDRKLHLRAVTRAELDRAFPSSTKQKRAAAIADRFPELRSWLPPPRRPWMTEDERMHIFDAIAFGQAFFDRALACHHRNEIAQNHRGELHTRG